MTVPAVGSINPILNYQGSLSDSTGVPYQDGYHSITFAIYGDSVGGSPQWTETQMLEIKRGLIHAYLGSINPFPTQLFDSNTLYLGIRFESNPEFSPRHLIAAAVYSFLARNSQQLEGFSASHFADSTTVHDAITHHNSDSAAHHPMRIDASEIVSGVLNADRVPPVLVDSNKILDGSIARRNLADSAVSSSKIAAGAIHNEHLAVSAFTGANIADGTIAGVDLADSAVGSSKIATGAIHNEHLSVSAFTGTNIADGTVTGADLADSTVTGSKIAAGQIGATHLAANSVTGANIVDESIYGADIHNGSIGFNDIGPGEITSYHIADNSIYNNKIVPSTITGSRIQDGSVTSADLATGSIGPFQLANNAVRTEHVLDNSLTADDIVDEPGLDNTSSGSATSIGTTIFNWMSLTISAPSSGYIITFFNSIANVANGEVAQASITTSPTGFGSYGEARISSNATSTGANMTIMISEVFPVATAGDVTLYANVRAAASSSGVVDFYQGRFQAIFIKTGY